MNVSESLRAARMRAGLKQAVLAARMGTTRAAISRAECSHYRSHTLRFLARAADALDCELRVDLVPLRHQEADHA